MDVVRKLIMGCKGRIHMMGIGGVGMAGLAHLLKRRGFDVDGCDRMCGPLCHWLAEKSVNVLQDHSESHADKAYDLVIYTPAVNQADPELRAFETKGVPSARRGEILPLLLKGVTSIAVAGTHGKTTTATFIAHLLKECGLSVGWCIGGNAESPGGVAGFPAACDILVVEADESDGTLRSYSPDIAVVTNVEFDHMEHFESVEDFEGCFSEFVSHARRRVVCCSDDPVAARICGQRDKTLSYGISESAGLRIHKVVLHAGGSEFSVSGCGLDSEKVVLRCPGKHNVLNAAAAIAVGLECGADIDAIRDALGSASLPDRRYQKIVGGKVNVVSDYAHHPTEIRALIDTARREYPGRLRAVFQPHRYTRTKALAEDFPAAFNGLDELVLVPVYAASEAPISGGASHDLYARIRAANSVPELLYSRSLACAWGYYSKTLKDGDTLLVIGAGDVEQIGFWLKRDFAEGRGRVLSGLYDELATVCGDAELKKDFPVGKRTMFGTGGIADVFVEVDSAEQLGEILKFCHRTGIRIHILGGGGNVIVSDMGVRGVTVHMKGGCFGEIAVHGDVVRVGAGVAIGALLDCLEREGLSGAEFLEGVPGVIGGAVRMNAGAFGGEVGQLLDRIRCIDTDGCEFEISRGQIAFAYRSMTCLQGRIVLSADLKFEKLGSEVVARKREEIRKKRAWMSGKRSAGSVFRNPEGGFAGKLIEDCGFKGFRIGGVLISEEHANVFVNDGKGTSSDMICIMDLVSSRVRAESGTVLEREVVILE